MSFTVNFVVEGLTDEFVILRLLELVGLNTHLKRGGNGKKALLQNLQKYHYAAQYANWLVVVDLDQDADCAPTFIQSHLPTNNQGMLFRIAIRAIEAWLLADREHFAKFLNISVDLVPQNPDAEPNPKTTLVNLARRSRKTALREDIVPRPNSGLSIGPGYTGRIAEFISTTPHPWRPEIAAENSESLRRCLAALKNWKQVET